MPTLARGAKLQNGKTGERRAGNRPQDYDMKPSDFKYRTILFRSF
jgi:hypothetical protein